jgi:hypothetical protein
MLKILLSGNMDERDGLKKVDVNEKSKLKWLLKK